MSTRNAPCEQLNVYVKTACFMSTVIISYQLLKFHFNSYRFTSTEVAASPRAAKIQSQRKHDPLKVATIIHESQDVHPCLRTILRIELKLVMLWILFDVRYYSWMKCEQCIWFSTSVDIGEQYFMSTVNFNDNS